MLRGVRALWCVCVHVRVSETRTRVLVPVRVPAAETPPFAELDRVIHQVFVEDTNADAVVSWNQGVWG